MTVSSYREELISQIPALQLLMALGYQYLPPDEALAQRGGREREVVLAPVLEDWLRTHNTITHKGRAHAFSEANIREAKRRLVDVPLTDGLVRTNERLYELLTLGTSLEQAIDGDRRSFSLHYIDWEHPENNVYHVTEKYSVERRPDIVCFVNGIPLVVIECKRPDLRVEAGGLPYEEAVSQMLRNQGEDEIPHLFAIATWLVLAWKTAGWWGLDRWVLPALGTPWKPGLIFHERGGGGEDQAAQ